MHIWIFKLSKFKSFINNIFIKIRIKYFVCNKISTGRAQPQNIIWFILRKNLVKVLSMFSNKIYDLIMYMIYK